MSQAKARHCVLMAACAAVLADLTPGERQKLVLARYTFLWADEGLGWLRRWRNELKREAATSKQARAAKPAVDRLASALEAAGEVRDYLAAKRQSAAGLRADDMEATRQLWLAVNPANVSAILKAALEAYEDLEGPNAAWAIRDCLGLTTDQVRGIERALPARDPDYWYAAADTAADLLRFTLPVAQGGPIGRRIALINDVALHLDALLRLAPVLGEALPYDFLIRSAIVSELSALLDLAVGPPPDDTRNVTFTLVDLLGAGNAPEAADELDRLRIAIGEEGWSYLRWGRNKFGAHIDREESISHLHEHLIELDYPGIVKVAERSLDWLDALGATQLELSPLLFGERKIGSWPTDESKHAPGRPDPDRIAGSLARLFQRHDSPYIIGTAGGMGSAVVMGMTAGRKPQPRKKVTVAPRPQRRELEPRPFRLPDFLA